MDIAAANKRCEAASPAPWFPGTVLHLALVADIEFVCQAREDLPAALEALEEAQRALLLWKEADDFRFGPEAAEATTAEEMNSVMLKNQELDEAARTALKSALHRILRGTKEDE